MQDLQTGGNAALDGAEGRDLGIEVAWSGLAADVSAFVLGPGGKVGSDADMIFFNQPEGAGGAARALPPEPGRQSFVLALGRLPATVDRVAFTLTAEDGRPVDRAQGLVVTAGPAGAPALRYAVATAGRTEAALILAEVYRRQGGWKLRAVGQGFNGGLKPLAEHFGVTVAEEAAPPPAGPAPAAGGPSGGRVDLHKKLVTLEKKNPRLVSLVKQVQVSLEKRQLSRDRARVGLVLDISASMGHLYNSGAIQHLLDRVMALGYRFDDDGEIDVFLFGEGAYAWGPVGVERIDGCVAEILRRRPLELGTDYARVMALVRDHYRGQPDARQTPVYLMFVTDGNTQDRAAAERELREAAAEPIFWQFMAIGRKPRGGFLARITGTDFTFLENLDTLTGRVVDNAGFFLVENPRAPSDEELFDLMMTEYPTWLKAASGARVLEG